METVCDLQRNLRSKGSDLLLQFGETESVVADVVTLLQSMNHQVEAVYIGKEVS